MSGVWFGRGVEVRLIDVGRRDGGSERVGGWVSYRLSKNS